MKPEYFKIRDHNDIIKNADNKALLNVSNKDLNKYREERQKLLELSQVVARTKRLEKDVSDIKHMLRQLLEKNS